MCPDAPSATVSVVIPAYDRPVMLREALESVTRQTYVDLEVVVVDDGSTEPLEPVVEGVGDDRIQYHRLPENSGAGVARNRGIDLSRGTYVAFLDDDDRWEPTKLERQVHALETAPHAGVAYTGQRIVDEDGETLELKRPEASGDLTRYLLAGGYLGGYSVAMVRRDVIEAAGRPDQEMPIQQDRDWWLQLSAVTEFQAIPAPLVIRRKGAYDQIGDRFEALRDVATPTLYERHAAKARAEGRRYVWYFRSSLYDSLGRAALAADRYGAARRYLLLALVYRPWELGTFLRLIVSLGGRRSYLVGRRLRDRARELRR